jgi:hypothetical protein
MTRKLEGGYQCGAVRYACNSEPQLVFDCHCTHCQRATGAPYVTAVAVRCEDFTMSGATIELTLISDRGTPVHRHSCANCDAYVFGISEGFDAVGINAVSLDDASWVRPQMTVHTASRQPWTRIDPVLPAFEQLPPMDGGKSA